MRKKVFGKQLSRGRSARKALFRSLVRSLFIHGSIETTEAKAKAVIPFIDKLMKLVRQDTVASRRLVMAKTGNDKQLVSILFDGYKAQANQRKSGFTRIIKLLPRKGDNARMVKLELVDKPTVVEKKTTPKKEKPVKKATKKVAKAAKMPATKKLTKTAKKATKK